VAPVLGALQLDDHQPGLLVDRQEIDPALAVVPLGELLREDVQFISQDLNLRPEEPLDVGSLPDSHVGEGLLRDGSERAVGHFVEGHGGATV